MRRPLFVLALAVCGGVLVGPTLPADQTARVALLAALLAGLALARPSARLAGPALWLAALGLAACLSALELAAYEAEPLRHWVSAREARADEAPAELWGRAAADTPADARRARVLLDVDELRVAGKRLALQGRVLVDIGGEAPPPAVLQGEALRVWATLRLPRGVSTPGAADAERRAFEQGLHALAYCKSAQLLERRGGAGFLARLRQRARERLQAQLPPGNEQALVRAMLLGDRSALDDDSLEAFRTAGTYHVLAISGAQVALVAALLIGALRRLGASAGATALAASTALVAYACFVGGDVPVARATITALIVVWGRTLDLDGDWLNLIGAAGLVLLLQRPSALTDAGFQLSFAATIGVLSLTAPLRSGRRWPLGLDLLWAASLAAQAAVAPILALRFQRLPLAGLLLNLAAVPLSTGVLCAGALAVLVGGLGPLAEWSGALAWCLAHALLVVSRGAALVPWLDRHVAAPAWWTLALHLACLSALAGRRLRPRDLMAWAVAAAGLLWSGPRLADGRAHVDLLDVGQAECIAITSPNGRVWLVDTGGALLGRFDQARTVVAPYLWSRGVVRIEAIVVSHAHPDHAGGLGYLLERFEVGEVWEGLAAPADASYRRLLALAHRSVRCRSLSRGVRADWDGLQVTVLGPPPPRRAPWSVRNDDSLVLRLAYGRRSFLLTGDVEQAGEGALPAEVADVLKVPHHGSRTSSGAGLLQRVAPRLALVSAGYRNRFGHPHAQVLAGYRAAGALLLRTDLDGALHVTTDGERLWLESRRSALRLRVP